MTDSAMSATARSRSTSAERTRLYRDRRRKQLRIIPFEVREPEIDELVRRGLLQEADRDSSTEVCRAIGQLLDRWLR